jgi:hypothetical protein
MQMATEETMPVGDATDDAISTASTEMAAEEEAFAEETIDDTLSEDSDTAAEAEG